MDQVTINRDDFKKLLQISESRRLLLIDAVQLVVAIMGADPDKWPKSKAGMIIRATKLIREADDLETTLKKYTEPGYFKAAMDLTRPDEELIKKIAQ